MTRSDLPLAVPPRARRLSFVAGMAPVRSALLLFVLSLALLLLGARFAELRLAVDIGTPADARMLVGFHNLERGESGAYRWSLSRGAVFLYGFDGRVALVTMTLAAPRPAGIASASTHLHVQGRSIGVLPQTPLWRRYHVLVPTNPAGDTALLLDTEPFIPGGEDTRPLGVALRRVEAQALANPGGVPWQRAVFLLSLPLLGWLLLRRVVLPARETLALGGGIGLAFLVGWAAARPLEAGYWLPTVLWPWGPLVALLLLAAAPQLRAGLTVTARWLRARRTPALWGGFTVALVAALGLRAGLPSAPGLLLVLVGVSAAVLALGTADVAASCTRVSRSARVFEVAALLTLTALALGLRLYALDTLPLGLWRDEARHGLLALRIWQDPSFRPVYVVEGADLPALLFYLMAPVVGSFGPHPWSARLVSAVAGGVAPLALWWAARPLIGPRAALVGAALIAWASWSLSLSRWAFPATLDHLLVLTAVGLMLRGLQPTIEGRWRGFVAALWMAGAGLCAGLAAYTYHSGRVAPLILAVLSALWLGRSRARWRGALPALLVAAVVGLLTLAPLLQFIAADYEGYNRRVGRVMILNSSETDIHAPLALLLRNVERHLLMWHVSGEQNGRHHAPGAPMLDPLTGLLFLAGIGLILFRRWKLDERGHLTAPTPPLPLPLLPPEEKGNIPLPDAMERPSLRVGEGLGRGARSTNPPPERSSQLPSSILLSWLGLALLPGLLSAEAPHAMRTLGALAPACMLAGLAFERMLQPPAGEATQKRRRLPVAVGVLLLASLAFNSWLYFGQMARDPQVYGEFDVMETAMARVAQVPFESPDPALRNVRVFLPSALEKSDTARFLSSALPARLFFDGAALSAPPGAQALILLPPDASAATQAAAQGALGPGARQLDAVPHDPGGRAIFLAFGVGDAAARLLTSGR